MFVNFANNMTTYHMGILFSFIFLTFLSFSFIFFETKKAIRGGGGCIRGNVWAKLLMAHRGSGAPLLVQLVMAHHTHGAPLVV